MCGHTIQPSLFRHTLLYLDFVSFEYLFISFEYFPKFQDWYISALQDGNKTSVWRVMRRDEHGISLAVQVFFEAVIQTGTVKLLFID
jgi:hypothetical protein